MPTMQRLSISSTRFLLLGTLAVGLTAAPEARAGAIVSGFNSSSLAANDDDSTESTPIGFTVNFFGESFNQLFVNNNGNVTFDYELSGFTPFDLTSTSRQIIAPFFADVDTSGTDSQIVTYGTGTFDGHAAFGVNWVDVGYFYAASDKLDSFQLLLVDRSDTGAGNFDIVFNYDQIQWETGSASDGSDGLGGFSARAGFSNGTGTDGTFYEIAGSAANGAFLDSNTQTGLIYNSIGSTVNGRYVFAARNGDITPQPAVPEPATLAMSGTAALIGLAIAARRRARTAA